LRIKVKIKKRAWIFLSILLILLLYVIWSISNQTTRTVKLEPYIISTEFPAETIFIRDEKIIRSPGMGQIFFEDFAEGERIGINQKLAIVDAQIFEGSVNQMSIIAESAGILSFYIDGFEEVFSGRQFNEIDLTEIKNSDFGQYKEYVSDGDLIAGGRPIFRIINPFSDVNFILYFPKDYVIRHGFELSELKDNSIILKNGMNEYEVRITEIEFSGESIFCFGRVLNQGSDFHNIRRESFTLVLDRLRGYMITKEAIIYNAEGEPGVFIQTRALPTTRHRWVRVDILEEFSNNVLINFDNSGHPVVINPQTL